MTHEFAMMVRFATAIGGTVAAFTTAGVEVVSGSVPSAAFGWSLIAGIAGAGVTYGVTTAKVNSAHSKIEAEKTDRIQSVAGLKDDMNRGFDHIERQLEAQTKTVIDALKERR
jgi:hypothetical protein